MHSVGTMLLTVLLLAIGYLVFKHLKLPTSLLQQPIVFEGNGWQIQIKLTSLQIESDMSKINHTYSLPQHQRPTRFTRPPRFTRATKFTTTNTSNHHPQRPTWRGRRFTKPTDALGPRTTRPPRFTNSQPFSNSRGRECRSNGMTEACNASTPAPAGCRYGKMMREHFLSDTGEVVTI